MIHVLSHRVKESRGIKIVGGFYQACFLYWVTHHFREARERFCHTTHFSCYIHIPHLISVARFGLSVCFRTFLFHVGVIVHAIPHRQPHGLGNEQCLVCKLLVVNMFGNIYKTSQLLVDGVGGCPHPVLIIICAIALYQCRMGGRNSIQISISIVTIVFLVFVKILPVALHLYQLLLWRKVASLPIAV